MAKRNRPPRRSTGAKPRHPQASPAPIPASGDQEAVDGILVQVKKTDLSIASEKPGQVQKLPGYEVCVAIPEWDKNRNLLEPVRKAHLAQQKVLARLQGEGVSRPWMIERFNEVDKALAATLATVAERIRTRRVTGTARPKEHSWRSGRTLLLRQPGTPEADSRIGPPSESSTLRDRAAGACLTRRPYLLHCEEHPPGIACEGREAEALVP